MSNELKELNCLLSSLEEYARWHYSVFKHQPENEYLYIMPHTKVTNLRKDLMNLSDAYFNEIKELLR